MEERSPKPIPAPQRDIPFMLNKCKPCSESGWWILQRDAIVLLLFLFRSLERPAALKCAMIGFECIGALRSSAGLKGGTDTLARLSSSLVRIALYICHISIHSSVSLLSSFAGGCSISPPVLSTPFVGFYLDCAAYLISQFSPASAGSKSAAQTMVRTIQQCPKCEAL